MAMDFFESQDAARKHTGRLVVLFCLAVLAIIGFIYLLISGLLVYMTSKQAAAEAATAQYTDFWNPELLVMVALGTLLVVTCGSLYKLIQLRAGGGAIAESLGGRRVYPDSKDPLERKVLNVVEEMAIASGTPAPPVYLLDQEMGINAFAAGFSPTDAVIGVTAGTATRLSRDELQGVIAHEFSHIMNGDMRLNLRLIGILHGILIIGILGYFVLRSAAYSGMGGGRRRSNPLPFMALGAGLAIIGYAGTFFGRMIQSAVSRQREFLADASAVQFTRNPEGIGGALKKIGGFADGSAITSPNAPEVSHMFFGAAMTSFLGGLFATHPPLEQRIGRIDPAWKGQFPDTGSVDFSARPEPARAAPAASLSGASAALGFAGPGSARASASAAAPASTAAGATASAAQGHVTAAAIDDSVSHIGHPTQAHLGYAAKIVRNLPPSVIAAAREPYGARALVYAMLIDRDPAVRAAQLERLTHFADPGVFAATEKLLPLAQQLEPRVRLPLADLAVPALRMLSHDQYQAFEKNVKELVKADEMIDIFEWTLQRILLHHVQPEFVKTSPPGVRYNGLDKIRSEVQVLLSVLAYAGDSDLDRARAAFDQAANFLKLPRLTMQPWEHADLPSLDAALDRLNQTAPRLKSQLLKACTLCVTADRQITVAEAELLRAISDSLGVPLPPFIPGEPVK